MAMLDMLPSEFWEESQNIYRKFKKGNISLDECFQRQSVLARDNLQKIKKVDEDTKKNQEQTNKNDDDKIQKSRRADAIFEKIRARSEKAKKEEENTIVKEEKTSEEVFKSSNPYNCEECAKDGKSYFCSVLNLFEGHIKRKHPNYQPFKCEKCDFKSHRKANLNRHTINHHKS